MNVNKKNLYVLEHDFCSHDESEDFKQRLKENREFEKLKLRDEQDLIDYLSITLPIIYVDEIKLKTKYNQNQIEYDFEESGQVQFKALLINE